MTTATTVLLQVPPSHRKRTQWALLLEGGQPLGSFQDGKAIDAAQAQVLLQSREWITTIDTTTISSNRTMSTGT